MPRSASVCMACVEIWTEPSNESDSTFASGTFWMVAPLSSDSRIIEPRTPTCVPRFCATR